MNQFDRMMLAEAEKHRQLLEKMALDAMDERYGLKPQGGTMLTVGKVILTPALDMNFMSTSSSRKEESIRVLMDESGICFDVNNGPLTRVSPQKAIELGQMLLKAAEAQGQYAVAAKELADQKSKLDAKYTDLISGLGLEALVDRLDENGALKRVGP